MPTITPTIGRVVLFVPAPDLGYGKVSEPFAATVAAVNPDGTVNLSVADRLGFQFSARNVTLVTDGTTAATAPDAHPGFCHWMDYQLKQAEAAAAPAPAPAPAPAA